MVMLGGCCCNHVLNLPSADKHYVLLVFNNCIMGAILCQHSVYICTGGGFVLLSRFVKFDHYTLLKCCRQDVFTFGGSYFCP